MDFHLPEIGEGLFEAELIRWKVAPGSDVQPGQGLVEIMTDKATMEVPAPFAGTVTSIHGEEGSKVRVGQLLCSYTPAGADTRIEPETVESAQPAATIVAAVNSAGRPKLANGSARTTIPPAASPSVRHLARKLGIDLTQLHGSGPGGRILLDDLTTRIKTSQTVSKETMPVVKEPDLDLGVAGKRMKLQGLRRRIAEHLVHAKHTIPHFTYVDECEVTELVRVRSQLRESFARNGSKLTYLAFMVRAVVSALKEVPIVNASLDDQSGEIMMHEKYHIGIAVATSGGLIVPVIRDADRKDLPTIAREIERLSIDARAGRAKLEDVRGSTFSITSIGNIGGLIATPIINHPEVGILGIGKVVKRPVFDDRGDIRPAEMMYLSFSFDHRVVDGAVGAVFGNAVIRQLQNPARLLMPPGWE